MLLHRRLQEAGWEADRAVDSRVVPVARSSADVLFLIAAPVAVPAALLALASVLVVVPAVLVALAHGVRCTPRAVRPVADLLAHAPVSASAPVDPADVLALAARVLEWAAALAGSSRLLAKRRVRSALARMRAAAVSSIPRPKKAR